MARDFLQKYPEATQEAGGLIGAAQNRRSTRLEQYQAQKQAMEQRIALLDEAIAALKSNPETERIINLLDAL